MLQRGADAGVRGQGGSRPRGWGGSVCLGDRVALSLAERRLGHVGRLRAQVLVGVAALAQPGDSCGFSSLGSGRDVFRLLAGLQEPESEGRAQAAA